MSFPATKRNCCGIASLLPKSMCCTLVPLIIGGNEGKESIHLSGRPLLAVLPEQKREQGMKATIERATLLKSLSHVQSVVERRNPIPILSNVRIEAAQDRKRVGKGKSV